LIYSFFASSKYDGVTSVNLDEHEQGIALFKKRGETTMAKKNEAEMPENTNGFSLANFFQGTKEELEKVVWPSRKQLVSESAGVLLMVTLSASLIYLVDGLFGWVAQQVF
jgi:preprotein translocase subunit SecE